MKSRKSPHQAQSQERDELKKKTTAPTISHIIESNTAVLHSEKTVSTRSKRRLSLPPMLSLDFLCTPKKQRKIPVAKTSPRKATTSKVNSSDDRISKNKQTAPNSSPNKLFKANEVKKITSVSRVDVFRDESVSPKKRVLFSLNNDLKATETLIEKSPKKEKSNKIKLTTNKKRKGQVNGVFKATSRSLRLFGESEIGLKQRKFKIMNQIKKNKKEREKKRKEKEKEKKKRKKERKNGRIKNKDRIIESQNEDEEADNIDDQNNPQQAVQQTEMPCQEEQDFFKKGKKSKK